MTTSDITAAIVCGVALIGVAVLIVRGFLRARGVVNYGFKQPPTCGMLRHDDGGRPGVHVCEKPPHGSSAHTCACGKSWF